MIDERIETQIDSAESSALNALQTVRASLKGAGQESIDALKQVTDRATALPTLGANMRAYIDQLKADDSQPADYRSRKAADLHKAATDRLREDRDHLVKHALPALERTLGEATLPQPHKDAGARQLVRGELSIMVSGLRGPQLVSRMTDLLGVNPAHDGELLSDYGRALLEAGGAGTEWGNFRSGAVAKLLTNPVGTERQLANRRALAAFHQMKVRGHVDGLSQIAKHRLGDL